MDEIEKYFNAERAESLLFILVAVIALLVAGYFLLKLEKPYLNGISYALISVAIIQLTVGTSIFLRSPKDIKRVERIIQTDSTKIQSEEIPRMKTVMKNFVVYRWVEIALILFGIFLFSYNQSPNIWKGVGLGLIIQASLMLLLDYFAEARGKHYLEFLKTIV